MISARGLHGLVPSSILAGRWIVVLVCYLDDSGKHRQSRITTVAGFVAKDDEWKAFETEVEPLFAEYGVRVLHAADLHQTTGDFANWRVIKKQSFVHKLTRVMSAHVPLGVSMSALKSTYMQHAKNRKRTVSPYTFCSNVILDWILRDVRVGKAANTEGVTFIFEAGHENNIEAEKNVDDVRKLFNLDGVIGPISFVPKTYCRAIQMADLLAFYTRRDGAAMENKTFKLDGLDRQMLNIINGNVPIRAYVATAFGPNSEGSHFLAGDGGPLLQRPVPRPRESRLILPPRRP